MKFKENSERRENNLYPNIDLEKTGIHLKHLIEQKGYTVKDIQKLLHLACPQPVYRWFKGQVLPSVDHLYTLSKLLHVHMEELLFPPEIPDSHNIQRSRKHGRKCPGFSDVFVLNNECPVRQEILMSKGAVSNKYNWLARYWIILGIKKAYN